MNKKYLILSISILAILVIAAVAGIVALYSDATPKETTPSMEGKASAEQYILLPAIPSDAVLAACFENLQSASRLISDSTKAVGAILGGNTSSLASLMRRLADGEGPAASLRHKKAAVSLHFSGDMVPLLVLDLGDMQLDTSSTSPAKALASMVSEEGLFVKEQDCADYAGESLRGHTLLLVSESEPLVSSSSRHITGGVSILSAKGFTQAASLSKGKNVIFVNHDYSSKLISFGMSRRFNRYAGFLGNLVPWSSLSVTEDKPAHFAANGQYNLDPDDAASYFNVFQGSGIPETRFPETLPSGTDFAVSLSVPDLDAYFTNYRRYLDSRNQLDSYSASNVAARGAVGKTLEEWAKHLGIKEVCKAYFHGEKDLLSVTMCRTGGKNAAKDEGIHDNPLPSGVTALFGELFSQDDNSLALCRKGWIITGSRTALETISGEHFLDITLKAQLSDAGVAARIPDKGSSFVLFYSAAEDPTIIDNSFRPALAAAMRKVIEETTFTPMVARLEKKDNTIDFSLDADRLIVLSGKNPLVERDTTVVVPEGPFKVTNSGTGKTNLFYQNSNMFLCLKEEEGKGLWGVPFKTPICGSVSTIDYYANGKLQFLFGSGSSMYLIDRLGRFVKPFPVDLGKEILIGPQAYDFTGAHGYSAVVLHKDNTIAMYDLHGRKPAAWTDITCKETIKGLPELLEVKGTRYWVVRTSLQTRIYPFNGGEPLTKGTGNKMIRPESEITIDGGSVQAVCYDGKTRNIKL